MTSAAPNGILPKPFALWESGPPSDSPPVAQASCLCEGQSPFSARSAKPRRSRMLLPPSCHPEPKAKDHVVLAFRDLQSRNQAAQPPRAICVICGQQFLLCQTQVCPSSHRILHSRPGTRPPDCGIPVLGFPPYIYPAVRPSSRHRGPTKAGAVPTGGEVE